MTEHTPAADSPPQRGVIYTLGCGELLPEHLCRRLMSLDVSFVVDVRSAPFEISRPDLYPSALKGLLEAQEIRVVSMSDTLGDRPEDVSVYVQGGKHIDYQRCRQRPWFQRGVERLHKAYSLGLRVCVLGREPDPCKSHLARAIGEALWELHGVELKHLTASGPLLCQHEVRRIVVGQWGQPMHLSWA